MSEDQREYDRKQIRVIGRFSTKGEMARQDSSSGQRWGSRATSVVELNGAASCGFVVSLDLDLKTESETMSYVLAYWTRA